jgi:hypothetical protein
VIKTSLILSLAATLMAGSVAMAANADFRQLDVNNDGKITLDEGLKLHPDWTADSFKALDLDSDNALNETEFANVQAAATQSQTAAPKTDAISKVAANVARKDGPASYLEAEGPNDVLASKLIGMRVYAVNSDLDETKTYPADSRKDWSDVGEVNDVVLDMSGNIKAVVLGVGGFLGIGEKDVAVEISSLHKVRENSDATDWFLVVNTTKDMLTNAPSYNHTKKS